MSDSIPVVQVPSEPQKTTHNKRPSSNADNGKIYVRSVNGLYQKIRGVSLALLFAMYFGLVWVEVDGSPLIWFDLVGRKFHLFGATFWPQDFFLLALALIICAFGLFFITALFGRIWCGYTCPQTAWTMMFIWLEEKIEGSRLQRMRLDKAPWSTDKVLKKTAKHVSWVGLAFLTGLSFVGYFYPIRELVVDLAFVEVTSTWALFWIGFFTVATYLNAGWVREKVCLHMCPYARFQSVMFNSKTRIIGYDAERGEPRGAPRAAARMASPDLVSGLSSAEEKAATQTKGDCVDCTLCVQVCPTGIDIREGLQYECIGCALCIDACDEVMRKIDKPTGLIRYASEQELETGQKTSLWDLRAVGYGSVLLAAVCALAVMTWQRPAMEFSAERERGALYYENGDGWIENAYQLKVINKSEFPRSLILELEAEKVELASSKHWEIGPGEQKIWPVALVSLPGTSEKTVRELEFIFKDAQTGEELVRAESKFMSPSY